MDIVRKCPNCGKCYFYIEGKPCPFCGKRDTDFNPFKEIFENDNPFSGLGVT
jgi:uncharacterized OB-fold protein